MIAFTVLGLIAFNILHLVFSFIVLIVIDLLNIRFIAEILAHTNNIKPITLAFVISAFISLLLFIVITDLLERKNVISQTYILKYIGITGSVLSVLNIILTFLYRGELFENGIVMLLVYMIMFGFSKR